MSLYTGAKPKTRSTFFKKSNKTANAPTELFVIPPFTTDLTQPNTYTPLKSPPSQKRPTRSTLNYVPLEQVDNPEAILRSKKIRIQNTDNQLIFELVNRLTGHLHIPPPNTSTPQGNIKPNTLNSTTNTINNPLPFTPYIEHILTALSQHSNAIGGDELSIDIIEYPLRTISTHGKVEHHDEDCNIAQTVRQSTPARAETNTPRVSTSQCNNRLDNNGAREHPIQTANPSPPTGLSVCIFRDLRPSFPLSTPALLFRTIAQLNQTRGKEETHESSTTLAARSERADSPFVCICDRCSQRNKIHSPLCENTGPIRGRSADLHHSAPERSEYQTHDTTRNLLSHPATRNPSNNTEHKTPDRDHAILYKIQSTDQTPVRPQPRYTPAVTLEDQNPDPSFSKYSCHSKTNRGIYALPERSELSNSREQHTQRSLALFDTDAARSLLHIDIFNRIALEEQVNCSESDVELYDVHNKKFFTLGLVSLPVVYGANVLDQEFIVTNGISESCILGLDAADKHEFIFEGRSKTIFLARDKPEGNQEVKQNGLLPTSQEPTVNVAMTLVRKVSIAPRSSQVAEATLKEQGDRLGTSSLFLFSQSMDLPEGIYIGNFVNATNENRKYQIVVENNSNMAHTLPRDSPLGE
ncbi:Uncharacterized protein APZ42_029760, partial [Daphnia magna]